MTFSRSLYVSSGEINMESKIEKYKELFVWA